MNILFLSIGEIEDIKGKGIYTDLFRQFVSKGHQLYLVSSKNVRHEETIRQNHNDNFHQYIIENPQITKNSNLIKKGLNTLYVGNLFKKVTKVIPEKIDIILYPTPPITFNKSVQFIKKRDNAKSYLILKDIFPQNAVDLGMFSKRSLIYRYFRSKEKKLYAVSDFIGCLSPANVKYVCEHNPEIPAERVEVCPNSVEPDFTILSDEEIKFLRKKYSIPHDKIVFVFGGNFGKPQDIGFVIECLKTVASIKEAFFLIVGSGTEYPRLKKYMETENPCHVLLLSQLPRQDYEKLTRTCDVGIISLDRRFTIPNFPSRLLSYMQAGIPVLCATDVHTDIGRIAEEGKFGIWCESKNVEDFKQQVISLLNGTVRKEMGENAKKYLMQHYTVEQTYETIMKHFS